jgi:hypothetical protein
MKVSPATAALALGAMLTLMASGCGSDSSSGGAANRPAIKLSVLGETIARDIYRQYGKASFVDRCRTTGDSTYECIARAQDAGTEAVLAVRVDKAGAYQAVSSVTGVATTGTYPPDAAYRGLDGGELMRAVVAEGKRAGQIPPGSAPAEAECELNQQQDRTYDCYLTSAAGQSTREILVDADGSFSAPDSPGGMHGFEGQLPKSLATPRE